MASVSLAQATSELMISGIIDGPLSGGVPKAMELYVLNNIADLSVYGVGSADNGGGSDGQEFTFPAVSVTAGEYIYIASESSQFTAYFGFEPDYTSGALSINGDDAMELFLGGGVVDVFGDINVDGTGQPWEYLDGWTYRIDGSTPPGGPTFNIAEWTFSGRNAIDGCSTNSGCSSVFPLGTFVENPSAPSPATTPQASTTTTVPPPLVKIHEIQGSGSSVAITTTVMVEAIVTSLFYDAPDDTGPEGFFIQEEDSDADINANTSEGIYVYCGSGTALDKCALITVGDLVQVVGTPEEFFGMSQIDAGDGSVVVMASGEPLPTPVDVVLPAAGSTEAEGTFENLEGMLVRFPSTLVVSEYFNLARFGEIVLTETSRPYQFTHDNAPDPTGYAAFLADLAKRRIKLDDDNNVQNAATTANPDKPYPYPTLGGFPNGGLSLTNKMRGGDTIDNLTGVLHWSWAGSRGTDAWRLRPVKGIEYNFTPVNPSPTSPGNVGGGAFKVASFNVLNYFITLDERGANSVEELMRQRNKIVSAMQQLNADVLGLIEIENSSNDEATIDLVNALNAAMGAGTYDFVATGAIGTDAIKCAFLYKPATVNLFGAYKILDSSVDTRFIDTKNRPVLIQTFEEVSTGAKLTIAVNHFKSKGSSCNDVGDPSLDDGQANCPGTRANAALALADYLATDPTGSGDADCMIIGDLNAYKKEDAIANLIAAGFTDLAEAFEGPLAYSYLFDGQIGYLDYALANGPLLSQVTGVSEWHINADELPLFDYNDCFQTGSEASFRRESCANGDLYAADALRSSDHDPVLIGLNLVTSSPPKVNGDPHFLRWNQKKRDSFHGECDLVMIHKKPSTNLPEGLDVHLRTTIQDHFSYVESAAVRVGEFVFEMNAHKLLMNGVKVDSHDLPLKFGPAGYELRQMDAIGGGGKSRKRHFRIVLADESTYVELKSSSKFLAVSLDGSLPNAGGILGEYGTGRMLARDGTTEMVDFFDHAMEWQVNPLAGDPVLFQAIREPQLPYERCRLPEVPRLSRRRLAKKDPAMLALAEQACMHKMDYDLCVGDVLSTGDVAIADDF